MLLLLSNLILLFIFLFKINLLFNLIIFILSIVFILNFYLVYLNIVTYLLIYILFIIYIGAILVIVGYVRIIFSYKTLIHTPHLLYFILILCFLGLFFFSSTVPIFNHRELLEFTFNFYFSPRGVSVLFLFVLIIRAILILTNALPLILKGPLRRIK